MEYKQYHEIKEGNKIFHWQENVYFSQANAYRFLSIHELLKISSDIAVEDYRQQGMSREFLKEKGYGILVSRVAYKIHKMPEENQAIELVTWEEKPEPLQLCRCYKFLDMDGNVLISGRSTWLVVDINARRMMPSKKFTLRPDPLLKEDFDAPVPGKIVPPADMELWDTRKIRFSDLDANGHTTNSRYSAFIEDVLPEEYRSKVPAEFRINFSKEAMLDSELKIYGKISEDGKKITVTGQTSEGLSFESEIYYG